MSIEYEEGKVTKQTKIYRKLGQGITVFHDDPSAEVDIIAVPGLGTNPQECWTWSGGSNEASSRKRPAKARQASDVHTTTISDGEGTKTFNWLRDEDGLASLFPKSRIMLYDYASAWKGPRKVRATMKSICAWLLDDLQEKRKASQAEQPHATFSLTFCRGSLSPLDL